MNIYSKFSLLFFICGIAFFVIGILEGTVEGGIFIIFPFLIGSGIYALFGIIFFFFSFLFYMVGLYSNTEDFINLQFGKNKNDIKSEKSVKGGGVILIGPFPIIFGSNWKIAIVMMVLALLLIIVGFLLFKFI
jgi:uncharacterized protein (TIGR00304 family)